MPEKRIVLRSPFNGGAWVVPPESSSEFVEAMIARGFERMPDPDRPVKEPRTKEPAHG